MEEYEKKKYQVKYNKIKENARAKLKALENSYNLQKMYYEIMNSGIKYEEDF